MIITREITNVIMTKIEEDYVSFETAKLLKEKGFNEHCLTSYNTFLSSHKVEETKVSEWGKANQIYRPSQAMAMKWLRKKGIYITIVYGDYPSLNKVFWTPQIDSLEGFDLPIDFYKEYDKYEEACEAAIKYCLKHLI